MKLTKMIALLLALLLPCLALAEGALPEGPVLLAQGLTLGSHSISYPQLAGMADEEAQSALNAHIVAACHADELLARLPLVLSAAAPLTMTYSAHLEGNVLSAAMLAAGPVYGDGVTQVWSCVNMDLDTGEDIPLDALFAVDAETARTAITDWLEWEVAPELSFHLMNSELSPLPEVFAMTPDGLTLYYPITQLSTLSDRAGAVTLRWYELPDVFDFSEGSILDRLGAAAFAAPNEASVQAIHACVAEGRLPGIPAALGDSMQALTDAHRLLSDPDLYEGGRMFALEDSRFRSAWLLTDALTDKTWETSVVQGIRADRISLYGLTTGSLNAEGTPIDDWRALLGQPDATVAVDADLAELYRLAPGTSDYFQIEGHTLRLHADADGRLVSVILTN